VAAGVSKAHADVVLISGDNGGTELRRRARSSTRACRGSWACGDAAGVAAERSAQQITVQTDGKLQTGAMFDRGAAGPRSSDLRPCR